MAEPGYDNNHGLNVPSYMVAIFLLLTILGTAVSVSAIPTLFTPNNIQVDVTHIISFVAGMLISVISMASVIWLVHKANVNTMIISQKLK